MGQHARAADVVRLKPDTTYSQRTRRRAVKARLRNSRHPQAPQAPVVSEIDLRAELENARILHLGRLPPLRAERIVDLHDAAAVERVVQVDVSLNADAL